MEKKMRNPKVGATCKVWGEGNDRFKIIQVDFDHKVVILEKCGTEGFDKIYSIRYPPRPPSFYKGP
jgi:hypothetical protein